MQKKILRKTKFYFYIKTKLLRPYNCETRLFQNINGLNKKPLPINNEDIYYKF